MRRTNGLTGVQPAHERAPIAAEKRADATVLVAGGARFADTVHDRLPQDLPATFVGRAETIQKAVEAVERLRPDVTIVEGRLRELAPFIASSTSLVLISPEATTTARRGARSATATREQEIVSISLELALALSTRQRL